MYNPRYIISKTEDMHGKIIFLLVHAGAAVVPPMLIIHFMKKIAESYTFIFVILVIILVFYYLFVIGLTGLLMMMIPSCFYNSKRPSHVKFRSSLMRIYNSKIEFLMLVTESARWYTGYKSEGRTFFIDESEPADKRR
ncbi:hypothetical protein ACIFOE_25755 [Paenibacillus sp. NRS-1783]|uniref:hypothetical protein n=1 Tax=Paenibacillus sp. NRS-1783 TaxID=3233907 RepID=UPI003D2BA248